jgi:glycine cleavage system H protein
MARPNNLKYAPTHEWCKVEGDTATVGITDFAVEQLSDLVFVDLPKVGQAVEKGQRFGEVESTKTVSDLIAPVSGTVADVNGDLPDHPETISQSPFEKGWLIKIKLSKPGEIGTLLDAKAYQAVIDSAAE